MSCAWCDNGQPAFCTESTTEARKAAERSERFRGAYDPAMSEEDKARLLLDYHNQEDR